MHSLTYVQLAMHYRLVMLPSFRGLWNLKVLVLAVLPMLQELSSFESVPKLERLQLVALPSLPTIPDLAPLSRLEYLTVDSRGMVCCNGFLNSICDLSHPFCEANPYFMLPAATCLTASDPHATDATLALFKKFSSSVCQVVEPPGTDHVDETQVDLCGGVLFRQCPANSDGVAGICASVRMQVIMCIHDSYVIRTRKAQIQLGIGPPCNYSEEAWLGCLQ